MSQPIARLSPDKRVLEVQVFSLADAALVKSVPGRTWQGGQNSSQRWNVPVTPEAIERLATLMPTLEVSAQVIEALNQRIAWRQHVDAIKAKGDKSRDKWPASVAHPVFEPRAHQYEGFNIGAAVLDGSPAFGLWHDMGLGKTVTGLALAVHVWEQQGRPDMTVLIVCPASVITGWGREIAAWAKMPHRILELTGPMKRRVTSIAKLDLDPHFHGITFLITNYDVLHRPAMQAALMKRKPSVLICDEAHMLKSPRSERSKAARKIGAGAKRIALTGTPTDKLQDWYGIMYFLDRHIFGANKASFEAHFFESYVLPSGIPVITRPRAENLDELLEKAHSIAHAASKDTCIDLPEKIDLPDVEVELEPAARKLYDKMARDAIAWLESGEAVVGDNVLTRMMRLVQITGGFIKDESGQTTQVSEAKIKACVAEVQRVLAQEPKVVIMCRFTAEIDALKEALSERKLKLNVAILDGRTPPGEQRARMIDEFQEGDTDVIIVQEKAGGAGITLHAASTMIDYSRSPDFIPYAQKRDRIHRIGQKNTCTYINLIVPGTLDQAILTGILREKMSVHQVTVHQWRKMLG